MKKSNKGIIIIILVIVLVLFAFGALVSSSAVASGDDNNSSSSTTNSGTSSSSTSDVNTTTDDTSTSNVYELLADNDIMPYTISAKASSFLSEHDDIFPVKKYDDISSGLIDKSIDYKKIDKNPDKFGDKLMEISETYVMQIFEDEINGEYFTEILITDIDGHQYYVLYEGELDDVYQESIVHIVGLPLGTSSFDNVSGGKTLVVVLAGAYVEVVE